MAPLLLTKDTTFIIGPVAQVLGYLMNGIFWVLDKIGLPNTGLSIIFFTLIIYLCMLPMTIKQQKFSKLTQKMQPEINKIQAKYKNKTDQESQMRMNEETQAVYKKYGVSPMGSCLQLLIQMPILFALYRVIYNIPAYVTQVKEAFFPLVTHLMEEEGSTAYLEATTAGANFATRFASDDFLNNVGNTVSNTFIDTLNRFSSADWSALAEEFPNLAEEITSTVAELNVYNNFLGLNIANSPWYVFQQAWAAGSILGLIGSIIIPALAALTQLLNVALTPQSSGNDQTSQSMKMMNWMMPIMSAWFCFTLPSGMGLYWIAGAVIRSIQQVAINRYIDRIDMDAYLKKQQEKAEKKEEKAAKRRGGKPSTREQMMEYASMNTKNDQQAITANAQRKRRKTLAERADYNNEASEDTADAAPFTFASKGESGVASSGSSYSTSGGVSDGAPKKYKQGSLTAKANMVAEYNNAQRSTGRTSRRRREELNAAKNEAKNED